MPTVFVSHGAPTLATKPSPTRKFLQGLGAMLPRPKSILCISAHWETEFPTVNDTPRPETIHDFSGFSDDLYQIHYPAPGASDLADVVAGMIDHAKVDGKRGLDHGAWVPLMLMYPDADIPVCQLSVQSEKYAGDHLALGDALKPLRDDGVLILASGGAVHDLRYFRPGGRDVPEWAQTFEDWLVVHVEAGDRDAIAHYRTNSETGKLAHPTDEHFLPLAVAMGAATPGVGGRCLHRGFEDGALSMAAFAFD